MSRIGQFDEFHLPTIKQVALDKIKVHVAKELSLDMTFVSQHAAVSVVMNEMARSLTFHLQSCVLGKSGGRVDVDRKWPADWWQAVRERWAPKWWLKRHPVKHASVAIHEQIWRVCPHYPIKTEDRDRALHIQYLEEGTIPSWYTDVVQKVRAQIMEDIRSGRISPYDLEERR
jgi:hypothetical protein